MKKIFDIVEKKVILNENILLIPEFYAVVERYGDDALDVFSFIYYYCDYKSPFSDYDPGQKEERLMEMFNKRDVFTVEDEEIIEAMKLYHELQWTPTMELLDATKEMLFKMATYLRTASIIDGKDGNLTQINNTIKSIGPTIASYEELKEQVEKEKEKAIVRGGKNISSRER